MATYLLIPGSGGDARYWQFVVPLLQAAGHRAVAVELPNDAGAGLTEHADAVVDALHRDREAASPFDLEIVLVAQSMGGFAAPMVCERLAVSTLVLVNAMIPLPGETPGQWWDNTGQPAARRANDIAAGRDPDADFDPMTYFLHDVPVPLLQVLTSQADSGRPPAESIFASSCTIGEWPAVATRVISGRDDRFFPIALQRRIAQQRLAIGPDELAGGHLIAFSQPAALTRQLLAYRQEDGVNPRLQ